MKDKELIRKISVLERLPALLLSTIGTLFIICSLFIWIWFTFILSLKMFAVGYFAVSLGIKIENIIIIYIDNQLQKEMHTPDIVGKWEARVIDSHDEIEYKNQEKANKEAIEKIMKEICKN